MGMTIASIGMTDRDLCHNQTIGHKKRRYLAPFFRVFMTYVSVTPVLFCDVVVHLNVLLVHFGQQLVYCADDGLHQFINQVWVGVDK